jgi:hypothetical protein
MVAAGSEGGVVEVVDGRWVQGALILALSQRERGLDTSARCEGTSRSAESISRPAVVLNAEGTP